MAILTTVLSVLTCTFFYVIPIAAGIVSIIFASQVNSKYERGDLEGAKRNATIAKISWIISLVLIILIIILWVTFVGTSWDTIMEMVEMEMEKQKSLQQ